MSNALKLKAQLAPVTLIENQLACVLSGPIRKASGAVLRGIETPRGVVPPFVSMPLPATPYSFLAMPEGSE